MPTQTATGYLWAFIEPLLWILTFYGIRELTGGHPPPGMTMVSFITTGIVPYKAFSNTVSRASSAVDGNKSLLFYPQVRPLDLIIARSSLESLTLLVVFAVLLGGEGLLRGTLRIDDPLMMLAAWLLGTFLGTSLGIVVGGLSVFSDTVSRIVPLVLRPLFWISGIFFTAQSLPLHIRNAALINPVLHVVELTRGGFFTSYPSTYGNPAYVAMWALVLLAMGLMLERVARRRLEMS